MKTFSFRATYSDRARKLFSTAGRETVRALLHHRDAGADTFTVQGIVIRTTRGLQGRRKP